jgi:ATP-dependent Clp protease ATP-binding subunit ClpA
VFERVTTDVRAVMVRTHRLAVAAHRQRMALGDLAEALSTPSGNTAEIWQTPAVDAPTAVDDGHTGGVTDAPMSFDRETSTMLEQAALVAQRERAEHIGTEHLLAALVRTGPADIVSSLAARGATAEAVDALLARLDGGLGVERLPVALAVADRRRWQRAKAWVRGDQPTRRMLTTVMFVLIVVVVFVLCVWGP